MQIHALGILKMCWPFTNFFYIFPWYYNEKKTITMNLVIEYYHQLWDQIHTQAANSTTQPQRAEYYSWIRNTANTMGCCICKTHAVQYIQNNPPENATNLFVWSWEFHNDVNTMLGKPVMDYATAGIKYLGWS